MSLVTHLSCVQCGERFVPGSTLTCPACGIDEGILDVHFDLAAAGRALTREALQTRPLSHWRYAELLPLDAPFDPPIASVGWTPIIDAPRLAEAVGVARLRLKDDGRNPSGSFKDRPSSLAVALARQQGATAIACASTGNAASSLACSAAAAGLTCFIFVPRSVPEGKLVQLLAYGATVFKVRDHYAAAYELCRRACERFGWFNRNCAINPYLVEGKKTGGLELAEQTADDPPDWVACSIGDGCSIAGIAKGLRQMHELGLAPAMPRLLGVQAAGCAPIVEAARTGRLDRSGQGDTYADSINCPVPRNWRKAVEAVRSSRGAYAAVSDERIMEAARLTARLTGVFAEPAAAAAVAGVAEAVRSGQMPRGASVVAMITGNGLKDVAGARRAVGEPHEIAPDLNEVERLVAARSIRAD